jgi:hypothetical protein
MKASLAGSATVSSLIAFKNAIGCSGVECTNAKARLDSAVSQVTLPLQTYALEDVGESRLDNKATMLQSTGSHSLKRSLSLIRLRSRFNDVAQNPEAIRHLLEKDRSRALGENEIAINQALDLWLNQLLYIPFFPDNSEVTPAMTLAEATVARQALQLSTTVESQGLSSSTPDFIIDLRKKTEHASRDFDQSGVDLEAHVRSRVR